MQRIDLINSSKIHQFIIFESRLLLLFPKISFINILLLSVLLYSVYQKYGEKKVIA